MELKTRKEIEEAFEGIYDKRIKVRDFIRQKQDAEIIPAEELKKHDVAFFQFNIDPKMNTDRNALENILVDFEVDDQKGELKAKKLYHTMRTSYQRTMIFRLANYGVTWRAWTALPARSQLDEIWAEENDGWKLVINAAVAKSEKIRVLDYEEVKNDDGGFIERKGDNGADLDNCQLLPGPLCNILIQQAYNLPEDEYGKTWRCWSATPTEEQRLAAAWTE